MFLKSDSKTVLQMTVFCKNTNCPSSEKLLAFQDSKLPGHERDKIIVHLRFCEFCAAEIDFYAHHPQAEEYFENTEIPPPLFELAEALLSNGQKKFSMLNKLLNESESVKV